MDARLRELFGIRTLHEWWPLEAGRPWPARAFTAHCGRRRSSRGRGPPETVPATGAASWTGCPPCCAGGRAWYLSTLPEPEALRSLLARIAAAAGVRPVLDGLPAGVEAVRRGELLFLLNHGREPVTVRVPGTHRELLGGTDVTDTVVLGRYGVAVLRS